MTTKYGSFSLLPKNNTLKFIWIISLVSLGWSVNETLPYVSHITGDESSNKSFFTGNSNSLFDIDIGYAQSMLIHHQQALLMASLIRGSRQSEIQALAKNIVLTQSAEMVDLEKWLIENSATYLPSDGDLMGWMKRQSKNLSVDEALYLAKCESSPIGMSGMANAAALNSLHDEEIPITAREYKFIELMIEHHEGAINMSTLPSRLATTPYIRDLSHKVLDDQHKEIHYMRSLFPETLTSSDPS